MPTEIPYFPDIPPDLKRRIGVLVLSCLVMVTSGSFATFTLFADSFREKFHLSFSDINMISAVMNSSLYLSYLFVGPIYDKYGVTWCQSISAFAFTLGYLMIYLSLIQAIPTNAGVLSGYYFIGGFGSCGAYMAMVGANSANFDDSIIGLIGGILLLFYGIAGVLYSLIFQAFYSSNIEGFLLFTLLSVGIINLAGAFYVKKIPIVDTNVQLLNDVKPGATSHIVIAKSEPVQYELGTPSSSANATTRTPQLEIPSDGCPPDYHDPGQDQIESVLVTSATTSNVHQISSVIPVADAADVAERKRFLSLKPNDNLPLKVKVVSMTPKEMLVSPLFWSYAIATILQQGLTYQVNINAIIQTALGAAGSVETGTELTAIHIALLSASQSIGRFAFGAGSDIVVRHGIERSVLLVVAEFLLLIPPLVLASVGNFSAVTSTPILFFCSILVGLGWGAGGGLFPTLTRSLFGPQYYGTASAFVMMGVPIGIFSFNGLFGALYDSQLEKQIAQGGPSDYCYGNDCFKVAFISTTAVQTLTLISSVFLVYFSRQKSRRLAGMKTLLRGSI